MRLAEMPRNDQCEVRGQAGIRFQANGPRFTPPMWVARLPSEAKGGEHRLKACAAYYSTISERKSSITRLAGFPSIRAGFARIRPHRLTTAVGFPKVNQG